MKTLTALTSAMAAALLFTGSLHAQVPILLNYQSRVVVGTTNFDGPGQFRFALVNPAGTTAYWTNDGTHLDGTQPTAAVSLTVTKGLCSALLGDTTLTNMNAIPASVFANADVRLRVWFNDGTTGSQLLTPDQRIAPGAYLADGAVTSAKIASGAVGNGQLAPNAVQATNIAAGAVDSTKIANAAIVTGNLANGSVTAAKLGGDVGLWSAAGLNVYRSSGNVGIGTTAPIWPLDVNGSMHVGSYFADATPKLIRFGDGGYVSIGENNQDDRMELTATRFVFNNGNVGIGTTTPQTKLHVLGDTIIDLSYKNSARLSLAGNPNDNRFYIQADNATGTDSAYELVLAGHSSGPLPRISLLADTVYLQGNVGIGTFGPGSHLDVSGNDDSAVQVGTFRVSRADSPGKYMYVGYDGGDYGYIQPIDVGIAWKNLAIAPHGGNVGIGTTTPQTKLHVAGDQTVDGQFTLGGNAASGSRLIATERLHIQTLNNQPLYLNPFDGGGDVVVGGATTRNLKVQGTTTTAVLEITGGGDVAEPFAVSHPTKPEPGMVMAIDREHPGELCVATSAYARTVAGIISGANGVNPGLTLRQPGTAADGTYPVALSGRVYCWCDAAYGEIQPGDLLTTSDTPGHAMVATDFTRTQGATIGKAMTGLKEGKGLVLVLVTLQ